MKRNLKGMGEDAFDFKNKYITAIFCSIPTLRQLTAC